MFTLQTSLSIKSVCHGPNLAACLPRLKHNTVCRDLLVITDFEDVSDLDVLDLDLLGHHLIVRAKSLNDAARGLIDIFIIAPSFVLQVELLRHVDTHDDQERSDLGGEQLGRSVTYLWNELHKEVESVVHDNGIFELQEENSWEEGPPGRIVHRADLVVCVMMLHRFGVFD